jgi:ABC-type bacteriocin/lantibiotic exporter with double-glycine peptidase domain
MRKNKSNLISIAYHYLQLLQVPVTQSSLKDALLSCHKYPSIFTLTSTLELFGLETTAVNIDKSKLLEIPAPFVTLYRFNDNQDYILVHRLTSDYVEFTDKNRKQKRLPLSEFSSNWVPIIVVAEAQQNSGEAEFAIKRKKEQKQKVYRILIAISAFAVIPLATAAKAILLNEWPGILFYLRV